MNKKMKKNLTYAVSGGIILSAIAISFMLLSIQTSDNSVPVQIQEEKIKVFASFYPYYEFTRNVAGEYAIVKQYLPTGVEPHGWEPHAGEIQSLKDADVFVYNGLGMESYIDRLIISGEFDHVIFVKASDGIAFINPTEEHDIGDDDSNAEHEEDFEFDPHIWIDPLLVKQQVNNIRDGLIKSDPKNTQHYVQNALTYNEKLDSLDMKIKSELSSCQKDTIVSFHNAFTYLGKRYDIKVVALSGLAPDSEASASKIAKLVDFIKDNDIKIIFAEELVDPRLAEVIAEETGTEVMVLSPLEGLTPEEESREMTYIEKMEQDLDLLKIALECQ
ncbi:MAG: zinc ABC transporter substrate-binding protein [Nitrosarchaeum sp.]|nr:MAG: zinc ABC transporter substrate-binding protein [Nitrosarchaeum sp.]